MYSSINYKKVLENKISIKVVAWYKKNINKPISLVG